MTGSISAAVTIEEDTKMRIRVYYDEPTRDVLNHHWQSPTPEKC